MSRRPEDQGYEAPTGADPRPTEPAGSDPTAEAGERRGEDALTGNGHTRGRPDGSHRARTQERDVRDVPAVRDGNGSGIAALVVGMLAVTLAFLVFPAIAGVLLGIAAIVLGIMGMRNANRTGGLYKGLSVTGLVTGVLAVLLGGAIIIGGVAMLDRFEGEIPGLQEQVDL